MHFFINKLKFKITLVYQTIDISLRKTKQINVFIAKHCILTLIYLTNIVTIKNVVD